MSIALMSVAWSLELPPAEKLVLLALADWAADDGRCWPSIPKLASKSGVSERNVRRMIASLASAGHLTRTERPGHGVVYAVHPGQGVTPDKVAPRTESTETPDKVSANTPRTINTPLPPARSRKANEGTFLPSDWEPEPLPAGSVEAEAVARWQPGELEQQLAKFRAHWAASAEPGALKRDWQAAWRKWIITHDEDRRQSDDTGVGRRASAERMGGNHGPRLSGSAGGFARIAGGSSPGGELSGLAAAAVARRAARQAGNG